MSAFFVWDQGISHRCLRWLDGGIRGFSVVPQCPERKIQKLSIET